jgi:hypothetical protein
MEKQMRTDNVMSLLPVSGKTEMTSADPSTSENEDERTAAKIAMARQSSFRDEKQKIASALGGSPFQLLTSATPLRHQNKAVERAPCSPPFHDIPHEITIEHCKRETSPLQHWYNHQEHYQLDASPLPHFNNQEHSSYCAEEQAKGQNCQLWALALVSLLLLTLTGFVVGIVVFDFMSRSSSLAKSNGALRSGQVVCPPLDQVALSPCNITTGVVVPDCALGKYNELVLGYPGLGACDSAHMALVALAVATTNHDVDDPYHFLQCRLYTLSYRDRLGT